MVSERLFFRSTLHTIGTDTTIEYYNSNIAKKIKNNYLRFKGWELTRIEKFLAISLADLGEKGAIEFNAEVGQTKLVAQFERKQCSDCYYVNNLSLNEPRCCLRCNSQSLLEFPIRKIHEN